MLTTIFLLVSTIIMTVTSSTQTITDEFEWQQINQDGFGNIHNRGPRGIAIFNDSLIMGTANYNEEGGFIFSKTYLIRSFLYKSLINNSFAVDALKSDGCEIWCYNDKGLTQLVGPYGNMPAGFGNIKNLEVGVLIEFNGYLYAGIRNQIEGCQIWRTNDLKNWEMVMNKGNGNRWNAAIWDAAILDDTLYVGTMNFGEGCEVFRTKTGNLDDWTVVIGEKADIGSGFGTKSNFYVWSTCVYDNWLYVGTDNLHGGAELWKTQDGEEWIPVLAYPTKIQAKLHGAEFPRGFTSGFLNYRGGIRNMVVYKDELYCGFCGEDLRFNFWLANYIRLFTARQQPILSALHFIRTVSNLGLEIWKYNSTTDKWSRVVGGIFNGNSSGGFGDSRNEYPWSMEVYGDHLYVGTLRSDPIDIIFSKAKNGIPFAYLGIYVPTPRGGGELWHYDGKNWEQINNDGFSDLSNIGIREMKVYNNSLFALTMNIKTGCELWKCDLPNTNN